MTENLLVVWVVGELPDQPEEGLLEVVVRLGRDVVVLQVLLAVEHDGLGFDLRVLDVDLVAGEDVDGVVLAHPDPPNDLICSLAKRQNF